MGSRPLCPSHSLPNSVNSLRLKLDACAMAVIGEYESDTRRIDQLPIIKYVYASETSCKAFPQCQSVCVVPPYLQLLAVQRRSVCIRERPIRAAVKSGYRIRDVYEGSN